MNRWSMLFVVLWVQALLGTVADEIRTGEESVRGDWALIGVLGGLVVGFWRDRK